MTVAESVVGDGRHIRPHIEKSPNQRCPTGCLLLAGLSSPDTTFGRDLGPNAA